ncbi:MAG: hypothetical protein WB996_03420, partial [Ignavibacteriaceae bacterium]
MKVLSKFSILFIITCIAFQLSANAQQDERSTFKRTYYANGALKTLGEYVKGELNGYYFEYYQTGKIWKKWEYKDGKENGKSFWYFPDGKLSIEWNY